MDGEAMRVVLDKVIASVGVQTFGEEHGLAIVPEGFKMQDLRPMLPPPPRPVEEVDLLTAQSFIDYVKLFGTHGSSVVFADETSGQYRAVLDYHPPIGSQSGSVIVLRGHCDHRARYSCPHSPQWNTWANSSGKMHHQVEFARFIEDNLPDIVKPSPATMLQVALKLQVKKDVQFASDIRLDNGQTQLRYEETVRGTTAAGDLAIPDMFSIRIPIFVGGPLYDIDARLRYRLHEGKLLIGHELVRPAMVRLDAIQQVTGEIRAALEGVQLFVGKR